MKWGVRRWQNDDGTLTERGKARYRTVASDSKLAAKNTKQALGVYSKLGKNASYYADSFARNADRSKSQSEKYAEKYKQTGKQKYDEKSKKALENYNSNKRSAEHFLSQSDYYNKKYNEIASGKKKAGRDFITQKDYNITPIIVPGFAYVGVSSETRIIEK